MTSPKVRAVLRCIIVIGATLLAAVIAITVVVDLGFNFIVVPRIEKAIRATFPTFCSGSQSRMIISPNLAMFNGDSWMVSCDPNAAPWHETFVTIKISSCSVERPWSSSLEWHQIYNTLFENGVYADKVQHKLAVCP